MRPDSAISQNLVASAPGASRSSSTSLIWETVVVRIGLRDRATAGSQRRVSPAMARQALWRVVCASQERYQREASSRQSRSRHRYWHRPTGSCRLAAPPRRRRSRLVPGQARERQLGRQVGSRRMQTLNGRRRVCGTDSANPSAIVGTNRGGGERECAATSPGTVVRSHTDTAVLCG
jgi:hypothetical protein